MRAAIYARKSDDNAEGVERQVAIAKDFAASKGWEVVAEFIDNDVSGDLFDRPGLNKLLVAIAERPRPFDVLVIMDSSRLGRDMGQTLLLQQRIIRAGVRVFHYQDGQELLLNTPTQKLVASVSNYAAEDYRYQVSLKTRSALRAKAQAGDVVTGAAFGYRIGGNKRLVVDPEQAATVVRIFELAAEGYGARRIAGQLRTERIESPASGGWTASGVKKILARDLYRGVMTYGRTRCQIKDNVAGQPVKVKVAVPKSEWITRECQEVRIVPETLWQAAYARLDATSAAYIRQQGTGRLQSKPDAGLASKFLLSGFLKCGSCGENIIVIENGRSYCCSKRHRLGKGACPTKRISREVADRDVIEMLDKEVFTPEAVAYIAKRTAELKAAEPSTLEQERSANAAEITRLEGARQRLLDLLEAGEDPGGVRERLTERTRDLNVARARAEHLEGQAIADRWADPVYLAKLQAAIEERRVYLSGHPDRKEPLPVPALRSLLRKLVDYIIVERTDEGVGVRFNCILADSAWIEEKASEGSNTYLTAGPSGERAG